MENRILKEKIDMCDWQEQKFEAYLRYQNGDDSAMDEVDMLARIQKIEDYENGRYIPDPYDEEDKELFG